MQSEGSVLIDRPIEEVFQIANECGPQWSIIVVEDTVIEDKDDGGVGTTFRMVTEDNGQRMEFEGVVTHHDPPYATAVKMTGQLFDMEVAYSFEEVDTQTRVTQWSNVKGKGFFKLLLMLLGGIMKKASCEAVKKELNSLKEFCEQPIPADHHAASVAPTG